MNCAIARSSRASGPHITANRDLASREARSMSSRPRSPPTSSWAFGLKSNRRGVPQRRTSTFSSSLLPGGTDGSGRFGTWTSSASMASSTAFTSASSALMRSPTSRICACSAPASWPALRARPMASEAVLRWALRSSASLMRRRRSTSLARISGMSWAPPFWASARCTSSGRSRISRRSSTALRCFGGGGGLGLDASDRADLVVGVEVDDAHAHRVAALRRDVVRVDADDLALGRDHENVVTASNLQHADHGAVATAGLDVDDALARAALQAVLVERRALAVAALGDREDLRALLHDVGRDDLVTLVHVDAAHACRAAAHRSHLVLGKPDGHAELGRDRHLAIAIGAASGDHRVAVLEADGLDAARPWMRVRLELGLLHLALLRAEEDKGAGAEVPHGHAGGDGFALAQRQQIDHRFALRLASALGNLVHLEPVDLAEGGEEQEVGVRGSDEEIFDDVLFLRLHARHALAPATLATIGLDVRAPDVAGARDGDDHLLVGEEAVAGELGRFGQDLGAARIAVLLFDLEQLVLDDVHQLGVRGEDALELLDRLEDLFVLLDDLLPFQRGQTAQLHVEDGLGLDFAELQPPHQRLAGGVGVGGLADDADDDVELLDRLAEAGQDVRALFRPRELVARAPGHDFAAEADERLEHLLEIDDLRPTVDERQHDDPEARLHLRVLVELVQDDLRDLAARQLEHDADALAVRLVAGLRDTLDLLFPRQLGDLLDEARLVHLIRQLADDDGFAPAPHLLGVRLRPQRDASAA